MVNAVVVVWLVILQLAVVKNVVLVLVGKLIFFFAISLSFSLHNHNKSFSVFRVYVEERRGELI